MAAQCLAEGQVPRTTNFGNDQVVRNVIVRNGLVTYEADLNGKPMLSEVRFGLYSEVMQMGGKVNRFDWSARQPIPPADLPVGREVEFRATISGAVPGELVWAITNWGPERISVAGCTYTALHLKIRQGAAAAPTMVGDRWVDPVRLITYRHEFTMLDKHGNPVRTVSARAQAVE